MESLKKCLFCGGEASYVYDPFAVEDTKGRKWAYTVRWQFLCNLNWYSIVTGTINRSMEQEDD